jgi:hypothetical protein
MHDTGLLVLDNPVDRHGVPIQAHFFVGGVPVRRFDEHPDFQKLCHKTGRQLQHIGHVCHFIRSHDFQAVLYPVHPDAGKHSVCGKNIRLFHVCLSVHNPIGFSF